MATPQAPRWLLVAGLLLGIGAAAFGILVQESKDLPPQAVARVNDRLILRDTWLRAIAAVASERRTPLTDADRRHILERLIDEELLVQHGVALGMVQQDRRLRGQLVSDVMMSVRAEASSREISDAELRRFFNENRDFFSPPARLRVAAWRPGPEGTRAEFLPPVPDALLPPAKLRGYLGPTLTEAAMQLQEGESGEAHTAASGRVLLEVLEREPGTAPVFEAVKAQVRMEMQRRADEAAVRRLLDELRESQHVRVRTDPP